MKLRSAWDSYWIRAVGGSATLFILLPLLIRKLGGDYALGVYIGTGIAVVWYTVETHYLRRETVRHNQIAIEPFVIAWIQDGQVGIVPTLTFGPQLHMKNIGQGLGLFIRVHDMTLVDPAGDNVQFVARFNSWSHLASQEEAVIKVRDCSSSSPSVDPSHLDAILSLDPKVAVGTYQMTIEYHDMRGHPHTTTMQMGKGGAQLVDHT